MQLRITYMNGLLPQNPMRNPLFEGAAEANERANARIHFLNYQSVY